MDKHQHLLCKCGQIQPRPRGVRAARQRGPFRAAECPAPPGLWGDAARSRQIATCSRGPAGAGGEGARGQTPSGGSENARADNIRAPLLVSFFPLRETPLFHFHAGVPPFARLLPRLKFPTRAPPRSRSALPGVARVGGGVRGWTALVYQSQTPGAGPAPPRSVRPSLAGVWARPRDCAR